MENYKQTYTQKHKLTIKIIQICNNNLKKYLTKQNLIAPNIWIFLSYIGSKLQESNTFI